MGFLQIADPEAMATIESHEERIKRNSLRLTFLEDHKKLCDEFQLKAQEEDKKMHQAIQQNTQAQMLSVQATNELSVTLCRFMEEVTKDYSPVVTRSRSLHESLDRGISWLNINRTILLWMVGTAGGLGTLYAAYHMVLNIIK